MAIPVKLRLENADNSIGIEVDVNTTTVDEWETLIFDFEGQTTGVDFVRVVVFYEFIVDLPGDGSTYFFDDVEVIEVLGTSSNTITQLSAFPNPAFDQITLQANQSISTIEVYSVLGQRVIAIEANKTSENMDVSKLPQGMYVINALFENGETETLKFVKRN